ncbi:MAG: HAMP domain-containing methyl-accepting chemotaxis protein [Candidatus Neomarinimicrobiota bacterium]
MKLNDLKINVKITAGFVLMLILLTIVGYTGYTNIDLVVDRVDKGDDANRLVKYVLEARQQEKNFILREDYTAVAKWAEIMDQTAAQIVDTKAKFKQAGNRSMMDNLNNEYKAYRAAFEGYVDLQKQLQETRDAMVTAARTADNKAHDLRASQKNQMNKEFADKIEYDKLKVRVNKADDANRLVKFVSDARIIEKNYMLRHTDNYIEEMHSLLGDMLDQVSATRFKMVQQVNLDQMDAIKTAIEDYRKEFEKNVAVNKLKDDKTTVMIDAARKFNEVATELRSIQKDQMLSARSFAKLMILVFQVGSIIVGLFSAWFLIRIITKPIAKMVTVMERLGKNDLTATADIDSNDELGIMAKSYNSAVKNVSVMLNQVKKSVQQVSSASEEISASSEELASGAEEQQSQASEVATSVEEMAATILQSSNNTNSASQSAKKANDVATTGGRIVQQTIGGMERISQAVRASSERIEALGRQSEEIGKIVSVIDDIADQTNLLALNANIEAARAGEQGRGFAVVADEVRVLAERTTKATAEIAEMIKGIQGSTGNAVTAMNEGIKEVDSGVKLVGEAGEALSEIIQVVNDVDAIISQVAAAAEEQSSGAEEISANVEGISTVTKQSATSAQQMAAAAQQLSSEAEALNSLVNQFKL